MCPNTNGIELNPPGRIPAALLGAPTGKGQAVHLTLNPRQAAGAGGRVAEQLAVAAADITRHADVAALVLFLVVDLLHARGAEEYSALADGQRLQEVVLVVLAS